MQPVLTRDFAWHFQTVHHDLWDYDNASPPALVTITHDGKRGTFVVMVDGTVRFIDQNISDEVFQAMCTINRPMPKDFDPDKLAPLIPPPRKDKEPAKKPTTPEV